MIQDEYRFHPIGLYHTRARYRHEAPRQPGFSAMPGTIELEKGHNFETALADLAGFDRIWVIFVFHLNEEGSWVPKVSPPLTPDGAKYGVFATRAPHRPNRIGMSCVELDGIEGLTLRIRTSDLLDLTPILDIKPYIPEIDAFPDAKAGWRDRLHEQEWSVEITPEVQNQSQFITGLCNLDLANFSRIQLRFDPFNLHKKRLDLAPDRSSGIIHCRTWQIRFTADEANHLIRVYAIRSNYKSTELLPGTEDRHADKNVHRAFLTQYPKTGTADTP